MTLPDANSVVSRKIKVLKSMCSIPGECSSKAVSQKKFQEVKLQNYPKVIEFFFPVAVQHETFRLISVTRSRTVSRTPWTGDQLVARPLCVCPG
jgi:hypothetical protein